jgi:hypothetical protein
MYPMKQLFETTGLNDRRPQVILEEKTTAIFDICEDIDDDDDDDDDDLCCT